MRRNFVLTMVAAGLIAGGVSAAEKRHGREESKTVAYLGVATESVDSELSRHLKLRPGEGLNVQMVDEKSPAAGIIQEDDILKEIDGQWLVNPEQLRTVVRMLKPGDEANITLIRDGDVKKVSVKLGEREVSAQDEMQSQMGQGMNGMRMSPEEMMQMFRGMHGNSPWNFRQSPQDDSDNDADSDNGGKVEISPGDGKPNVNVSSSTTVSENGETATLTNNNGNKHLKVTKDGKTLFDGAVSTDDQVKALSGEAREMYDKVSKQGPTIKIKSQTGGKDRVDI